MDIQKTLTEEFNLKPFQVANTVELIDQGNTIPFIARYRKEATGSLDDQVLRELSERLTTLRNLEKRRQEVSTSITEQGKMTPELAASLEKAVTMTEIEDLYRPFKPKRRTRASVAREKGLEPLALQILEQIPGFDPLGAAQGFVNPELGVETAQDALAGASDIIAEAVSDDAALRKRLRELAMERGMLTSKAVVEEDTVYSMYYQYAEPLAKAAGHRILALDRGEREEKLKVNVELDRQAALAPVLRAYVKNSSPAASLVAAAAEDAYDRLIFPSVEREVRNEITDRAATGAIKVFSVNLRQLLLQPPVRGKVALGLDPAYRTGCKIAVVDGTGKVLDTTVVYPTPPQSKVEQAEQTLIRLIGKHGVEIIAIGNGTASRESEIFVSNLIKKLSCPVSYMVVSEAGASVYSASKLAAEEFPEYDVSLRSAVSIARRLQDPLAELVKIDPKAIGVGQYQHDMPQKQLGEALDGVVENCVNTVGVDLNTASAPLLSRVAGINTSVAKSIVSYREENGPYKGRKEVLKVPKLGKKAFEQCAGFLRIPGGKNILDNTGVHPESYEAVDKLLGILGYTAADVAEGSASGIRARIDHLGLKDCARQIGVGEPTLADIVTELLKPGRDVRDSLPKPLLRTDIMEMKDLKPGMVLDGTVRNVIDFGAFVDIGVHQDGLVHISEICDRYIKHPSEVLKVGDIVRVRVLTVDPAKKRIGLSMKNVIGETLQA